jgi:hypothetical protein
VFDSQEQKKHKNRQASNEINVKTKAKVRLGHCDATYVAIATFFVHRNVKNTSEWIVKLRCFCLRDTVFVLIL